MPRPFKCSNCKKTWDAKLADIYEFIGDVCRECEEKMDSAIPESPRKIDLLFKTLEKQIEKEEELERERLADAEQEQMQLDYALELSKKLH